MKKTLNIHLGKQLFTIEEDAYESLQSYLKRLEKSFVNEEGVSDIMEDIEMRFAELLKDYLGPLSQVVTLIEVNRAIESLGEPEDIQDEETAQSAQNSSKTNTSYEQNSGPKRMFRDTDNGMLGGVASGLAEYLNIDPVIVRAALVIFLFLGFGFLLYIILWAIIPAAKSPSDRLQMKGKPVNIDTLKEEVEKAASRIKNDAVNAAEKFKSGTNSAANQTKNLLRLLAKIIGIFFIMGSVMWLIGFSLIITGIIDIVPTSGDNGFSSLYEFLKLISPIDKSFMTIWTSVLMIGFAGPLLGIAIGLRLTVENLSKHFKWSFILLPVIIGIGIILGILGGINSARDYAVSAKTPVMSISKDLNELIVDEMPLMINNSRVEGSDGIEFLSIHNNKIQEEGIHIIYKESKDSLFHIYQKFKSRGYDMAAAHERNTHMKHHINLIDNKLLISPFYTFPTKDGLRDQEVEVIIEVPKGKKLFLKNQEVLIDGQEYEGILYADEAINTYVR